MTGLPRAEVAGLPGTPCTVDELVDLVARTLERRERTAPLSVLCVNAHIANLAWDDPVLRAHLEAADVVALDGMAAVWAFRRAGVVVHERCNMTEAFRAFTTAHRIPEARTVVIGLDAATVARAGAAIDGLSVVASLDGYRSESAYVQAVEDAGADLVLVGCGTPRSEQVVAALAAAGGPAVLWHVGGGTLRFLAGDDREAPAWMRRTGLQWLHRLLRHPGALWRRYLLGNPRFVWRIWRSRGTHDG